VRFEVSTVEVTVKCSLQALVEGVALDLMRILNGGHLTLRLLKLNVKP
jgi:hypothetical protein